MQYEVREREKAQMVISSCIGHLTRYVAVDAADIAMWHAKIKAGFCTEICSDLQMKKK